MKEAQVQNNEFNAQDLCSAIQKRKILIVGIFFLSMIATAIVSIFQEPIFKGDAILIIPSIQYVLNNNGISREASLNAREIVDIIGVIDQEKKKRILPKMYASIATIKINASRESKDKMEVVIEAFDKNAFQPAIKEIINYCNSIDILQKRINDENEKLTQRSIELKLTIAKAEKIVTKFEHVYFNEKINFLTFNPNDLNKNIADLKQEKLITDQAIDRLKGGIGVARQLEILEKPVSPRVKVNIVLAGVLGLLLGLIFAILLDWRIMIKSQTL